MTESLLDRDRTARGRALLQRLRDGMAQVILGQPDLVDLTTIALAARGHVLLEGLPGLGKTELVKTLARLLGLSFRRIQFTPDLLPSDVTGGPVLQEVDGRRTFVFQAGPLFAHCVLADEINRASPKTQSAMLEAMQERRVTVLGESHPLPEPFFVLATQNPIELEGTYPLPEAQLDRFLFKIDVPPVGEDVLMAIVRDRRRGEAPTAVRAVTEDELRELFAIVDAVFLPEPVARYIARLVTATHPGRGSGGTSGRDSGGGSGRGPDQVRTWVKHGASPRAAIALAESARARALLDGRPNVDFDDVQRVARPAIAHRIVLDHAARLDGVAAADVVAALLDAVDPLGAPLPEGVR